MELFVEVEGHVHIIHWRQPVRHQGQGQHAKAVPEVLAGDERLFFLTSFHASSQDESLSIGGGSDIKVIWGVEDKIKALSVFVSQMV